MAEGERSQPSLPKNIGRYQIQANLGAGAMGAVYKGFDPLIKRTLAIKTIRLDIPRGSEEYKMFLERFYQEARISGTLSHPNIVTLFDIGEDAGLPFLALEFIEGDTVEALLARGVKFRPEKVISLISQIAAALDYAHSKGVIHRDIKPANLLIYEEDRIKVTDFGIAKLADVEMTKVGQLLGTPSYMSPEQAMGEKLDGRSDIFSLGVVAFEMLCGKQPFPGNNVTAILYRLVHVEPIQPDNLEMNGLVPAKWHEVFPKVLSKKRDDRYQTAAEFVRDLEYCLGTWFTGLGEDLVPAASIPAPSIPAAPPVAAPPVVPAPAAAAKPAPAPPPAPAPAAPAPSPVMARKSDDPSMVVSMDEIQEAVAYTPARRPSGPAVPADDDLPPTVAVSRPAIPPDDDEPPPTLPIQRPPIVQEKTIVLPSPSTSAPPQAATPPVVTKPSSKPPFKPASNPPFRPNRPGSVPPYKPPTPLASRSHPPRLPGPGSRAPAQAAPIEPPETEELARPSGGVPKLWLVAGAALLVLLVAVGVWFARSGSGGGGGTRGRSAGGTASGSGVIQVETTPAGAKISLNDQAKGNAPASLTGLAPGTYEVVAELSGHEPAFQRVTLREGEPTTSVRLTLQPTKSGTGEADILSRPSGASVTIDGQRIGLTPLRGYKLPVGNRRFRLNTDGYEPYVGYLTVDEGKTARLDARLVKLGSSPTPPPAPPPSAASQPSVRPVATGGAATKPTTAASAAPTTTLTAAVAPASPAKPTVDTARVYQEDEVQTQPRKLSGDQPTTDTRPKPGESLRVSVSFTVTESGDVADVVIIDSGGKPFDDAVKKAVRQWKYTPGMHQGVKVKTRLSHAFRFVAG